MIPHAETLRKIQVEHGVTGSFKDRPLAEWLQKHNPNDEQYDKVIAHTPVLTPHSVVHQRLSARVGMCSGSGELHLLMCWLLCGHVHLGDL